MGGGGTQTAALSVGGATISQIQKNMMEVLDTAGLSSNITRC